MKFLAIAILLLLPASVSAQQQATPSQVAIQIDNVINQWAQTIEAQQKLIADLQKQNAELKAKCGDSCKEETNK